LLIYIISK